ncbi:MAG: ATP-binding cassette domain-containing protein [Spirochaetaceae bacterium]|nr:ATP-binding cassette domain-containing protein [Spirochaetaceae bacterium]
MVTVEGVSKRYGQHLAVDDISFRVDDGEVVGFLGPNGAGKSTTMNIITGYLSATAGTVTVDGFDVLEDPDQVKRRVGYLPELPPLYLDMTVREYLRFVARLKKAERSTVGQQQERILELAGIAHVRDRLIKNLSKGYRQRVGLAQALVGSPRVLILDEPTIGLDPHQIIEIRNLIRELGHEHTIILSSHILPEVSAVCDRVIIINRGRLVASDTTENLGKRLHDSSEFRLRVAGTEEAALAALAGVAGVNEVSSQGTVEQGTVDLHVETTAGADPRRAIFHALSKADLPIYLMTAMDYTLEEIFLQLTTEDATRGAAGADGGDAADGSPGTPAAEAAAASDADGTSDGESGPAAAGATHQAAASEQAGAGGGEA